MRGVKQVVVCLVKTFVSMHAKCYMYNIGEVFTLDGSLAFEFQVTFYISQSNVTKRNVMNIILFCFVRT